MRLADLHRRFTVRGLMFVIAILGVGMYGAVVAHRHREYRRQADGCARIAEMWESTAAYFRTRVEEDPRTAKESTERSRYFARRARFMREQETRYRVGVDRPWVRVPGSGPLPD